MSIATCLQSARVYIVLEFVQVEGRYAADGHWYSAKTAKVCGGDRYTLAWADGDPKDCDKLADVTGHVRPRKCAIAAHTWRDGTDSLIPASNGRNVRIREPERIKYAEAGARSHQDDVHGNARQDAKEETPGRMVSASSSTAMGDFMAMPSVGMKLERTLACEEENHARQIAEGVSIVMQALVSSVSAVVDNSTSLISVTSEGTAAAPIMLLTSECKPGLRDVALCNLSLPIPSEASHDQEETSNVFSGENVEARPNAMEEVDGQAKMRVDGDMDELVETKTTPIEEMLELPQLSASEKTASAEMRAGAEDAKQANEGDIADGNGTQVLIDGLREVLGPDEGHSSPVEKEEVEQEKKVEDGSGGSGIEAADMRKMVDGIASGTDDYSELPADWLLPLEVDGNEQAGKIQCEACGTTEGKVHCCDMCGAMIHLECYLSEHEQSPQTFQAITLAGFRCEACNYDLERDQRVCLLCPQGREGALKKSNDGRWAHAACALYCPGVIFGPQGVSGFIKVVSLILS